MRARNTSTNKKDNNNTGGYYGSGYGNNNNNNNNANNYFHERSLSSESLGSVSLSSVGSESSSNMMSPSKSSYTSGMPLYNSSAKGKKYKAGGSSPGGLLFYISCGVAFLCTILALYQRSNYRSLLYGLDKSKNSKEAIEKYEIKRVQRDRAEGDSRFNRRDVTKDSSTVRRLEQDSRDLQTKMAKLQVEHASAVAKGVGHAVDNSTHKLLIAEAESEYRSKRELAWQDQVYILQNATQRESYRTVIERFGHGPYRVQFTLQLSENEYEKFTVEMAPLGMMPHANHLFLEQVYHELWDNTFFFLNGPHVLQAGPQDWESDYENDAYDDDELQQTPPDKRRSPLSRFKEARLESMTFPEYSPQYPHTPWTLGYTGRPGGPDWYINKADNSRHHGPHGQSQHDLRELADTCFARVIKGQDALQRIFSRETHDPDSDFPFLLKEPVEIVKARIENKVEDKIKKPEYKQHKRKPKISGGVDDSSKPKIKPQRVLQNQERRDTEREKRNFEYRDAQRINKR